MARLILIEDQKTIADMYAKILRDQGGYDVSVAYDLTSARALPAPDLYLIDIQLPDGDGFDYTRTLRVEGYEGGLVLMTGKASINLAVEALQGGADDFLAKPVAPERLVITVRNVLEKRRLKATVAVLARGQDSDFAEFVGTSPVMRTVYQTLQAAAASTAPAFITGESGTGKELAARALHHHSPRHVKNFVAVNCGALPENLIESELFGHVKGAFTGATNDRKGAVKQASGGTLFLDELGDMPLAVQVKLLRLLQNGEYSPVGSDVIERADIRVIAATNRTPEQAIQDGHLREDLFYRLNVIRIDMPPLRARGMDIVRIARHTVEQCANAEGRTTIPSLTDAAEQALLTHPWRGNVRELYNILRRAVILNGNKDFLDTNDLGLSAPDMPTPALATSSVLLHNTVKTLVEAERDAITAALTHTNGNVYAAAKLLGTHPTTLYRKGYGAASDPLA